MSTPILKTKLYAPPLPSEVVSRPKLVERLNRGLHSGRRLTLVSAPAGFGKSTLVAGWLEESDRDVAWLSLDEGDNDPVRFWTYIIAAIQAIHPEVGDEARQLVGSPPLRSAERVVVSLLNEIAELAGDPSAGSGQVPSTSSGQGLVLVLDDYQMIQTEQIHEGLNYLLDHQPPNLHLVLIARVDPSLSLARLRAHRQLTEIRAVDLQFSAGEAAALFDDVMSLHLEPEQLAALQRRTEGWIVGLQLAALSLRGQATYDTFIERFAGSHQFILDYLAEEVLRSLPDEQRQFLLRTSILGRFCSALCHAVTGDAASQQRLDEIRRGNLFLIPLESGGSWFRYHHLFADVLQALLERDYPGEMAALHLKAADWFEDHGYAGEAVDHALRSGDMQRARELVLEHWISTLNRGEVATILRWLDALPEEMERNDPSLSLSRCWALFVGGQGAAAIGPHLERAEDACERLSSEGTLAGPQQSLVAAQLAMMRSVLARAQGQHAGSVSYAERAVRLLPAASEGAGTAWNMLGAARAGLGDYDGAIEAHRRGYELVFAEGNLAGAYMCTYGRAMYLIIQGRMDEADEFCRSVIERGVREGHGSLPVAGWPHVAMARVELERHRLDQSQAYLDDGLRIARPSGQGEILRAGRYLRAHIAAARGDRDGAVEILQDTERIVDAMDDPYLSGELAWHWTVVCLNTGDLAGAWFRLADLESMCAVTRHANLLSAHGCLTPRLLCAEGRYDDALAALSEAIGWARASNSTGTLVRLLAQQAVALHASGEREPARSALREGLAFGAPGGYVRRWLDAGPAIAPLLLDVTKDDLPQSVHPYLDTLLDACQSAFGDVARQPAGGMLDPLTPRELEIVRLICAGRSGPEIAGDLVLAYNTVRKHISNIYSKLGVRSRTQAVARVRELNLL